MMWTYLDTGNASGTGYLIGLFIVVNPVTAPLRRKRIDAAEAYLIQEGSINNLAMCYWVMDPIFILSHRSPTIQNSSLGKRLMSRFRFRACVVVDTRLFQSPATMMIYLCMVPRQAVSLTKIAPTS